MNILEPISDRSASEESPIAARDEVKEIENQNKKETRRVRTWRLIVTFILTTTGISVASSSYLALLKQEEQNFEDAYNRFSSTVGQAAVEEMLRLREAASSFGDTIEVTSKLMNASWPFYDFQDIGIFAQEQADAKNLENLQYLTRVRHDQREAYLDFQEGIYERWVKAGHERAYGNLDVLSQGGYMNDILAVTAEGVVPSPDIEEYYPLAFRYPPPNSYFIVNLDIKSINYDDLFFSLLLLKNQTLISNVNPYVESDQAEKDYHASFHDQLPDSDSSFPHSFMFRPVHEKVEDPESEIVAVVLIPVAWDASLRRLLPDEVVGMIAVGRNNCGQQFTYEIVGEDAYFMGWEDLHDPHYDDKEFVVNLDFSDHADFMDTPGHCAYTLSIYPSDRFADTYKSTTPLIYVVLVGCTFALMIAVFFVYDWFVERRNDKLTLNAAQSNEIVTSMFPGALRDKIMDQQQAAGRTKPAKSVWGLSSPSMEMKSMIETTHTEETSIYESEPLAELYPACTIAFMDVVGFTAWSSVREPKQVFVLLETVYRSFDTLARKRKVFKVETVGDCYVAASGFPEKQVDHALRMCRFGMQCVRTFSTVVTDLETRLGPDTGDLGLRVGIHSGQVVAGVLRGDRARFQLFGDTMNTCARIEGTSESGRIHISEETAELLRKEGKEKWLIKRQDLVDAKGKGLLQTYWLSTAKFQSGHQDDTMSEGSAVSSQDQPEDAAQDRTERLIDWNVSVLLTLLRKIVARRETSGRKSTQFVRDEDTVLEKKECFLDELSEIINLPGFDPLTLGQEGALSDVNIDPQVEKQLRQFVTCCAHLYRSNPFHNFEHASHVAMSTMKLLSRIVAPSENDLNAPEQAPGTEKNNRVRFAATLHDHTYGITSDPLTQFACVFSALIHDVDHTGVPNTRLIEEQPILGERYHNRSVAEQNSLEMSWDLLMDSSFDALRRVIYTTPEELKRFRELVVNVVLATDITDKDLKTLRNARWTKAFATTANERGSAVGDVGRDAVNRKATIVMEHLIQASDVSHTMQHWHVYLKWNERLFRELYKAWKEGRAEKNPAEFWAKGEIGFFDFYVIPLAKKLKECGVFGVSSDEYLQYALKNRSEWQDKGEQIVAEMIQKVNDGI